MKDEKIKELDRNDFYTSLHPSDKDRFKNSLETKISKINDEEIEKRLKTGLLNEERHDSLIEAVASGFHQNSKAPGYKSGYKFAFTEPLIEKGVKNGDVLLARPDENGLYLCIVECKSGSENYCNWINHIKDIYNAINQKNHKKILKSQLGVENKDIKHIQFVLLSYGPDSASIDIEKSNVDLPPEIDLTVWGYSSGENKIFNNSKKSCKHKDLRNVMEGGIDFGKVNNPIEYTLNTHRVLQLQKVFFRLLRNKKRNDDDFFKEFNEDEFYKQFEKKLQIGVTGKEREKLIGKKTENLIEMGLEIGVIKDSEGEIKSSRDYRINFKGSRPDTLEDAIKEKFIKNRIPQRKKKSAFNEVKDNFSPKKSREQQKFLEEFC